MQVPTFPHPNEQLESEMRFEDLPLHKKYLRIVSEMENRYDVKIHGNRILSEEQIVDIIANPRAGAAGDERHTLILEALKTILTEMVEKDDQATLSGVTVRFRERGEVPRQGIYQDKLPDDIVAQAAEQHAVVAEVSAVVRIHGTDVGERVTKYVLVPEIIRSELQEGLLFSHEIPVDVITSPSGEVNLDDVDPTGLAAYVVEAKIT